MQCRGLRGIEYSCLIITMSVMTCGLAQAQTANRSPPPLTPNEQKLRDAIKADLEKKIADIEETIKPSRKSSSRGRSNMSREERKERRQRSQKLRRRLGQYRTELKKVDKGTSTYMTELAPRTLEVGQIGKFGSNVQLKVVQVLDDDQVLVEYSYQVSVGHSYWAGLVQKHFTTWRTEYIHFVLEGVPATNLVAGRRLDLKDGELFEVHGTTLNSGLSGRTTHVVRAFDRSK